MKVVCVNGNCKEIEACVNGNCRRLRAVCINGNCKKVICTNGNCKEVEACVNGNCRRLGEATWIDTPQTQQTQQAETAEVQSDDAVAQLEVESDDNTVLIVGISLAVIFAVAVTAWFICRTSEDKIPQDVYEDVTIVTV